MRYFVANSEVHVLKTIMSVVLESDIHWSTWKYIVVTFNVGNAHTCMPSSKRVHNAAATIGIP